MCIWPECPTYDLLQGLTREEKEPETNWSSNPATLNAHIKYLWTKWFFRHESGAGLQDVNYRPKIKERRRVLSSYFKCFKYSSY